MILSQTSTGKPSRIGFWIVLGLGALLLPLAPQMARTQAPEQPNVGETKVQPAGKDSGVSFVGSKVADIVQDKRRVDFLADPVTDRSEEIEKMQADIELLKVQVRVKEARIDATARISNEYKRRLEIYIETNRKHPGAIPRDTLEEVRISIATQEGQLQIYKAEGQETLVRLKQAERRLARLQRPAVKGDGGGRTQQEKRLRELEQKVENLLKEIHKLRKEMQPDKPSQPRPASSSSQ